ncbi:hypothetical protein CLV94_0219 [Flavobacterium endophyticum]|uniref:NlpE-like protein n=1 Tax=Flavobacterium endophyticum TaxID=1540163 RepID=A0A495MLI2_9FLAO|nr:hypothetical protein [Flavobacterium endophyticum]RKS25189.1 hypothetical protein CLV94_0219 [Flavobacterium endophyticum]
MKTRFLVLGMIISLAACNKKAEDTQVVTEPEMEQPEITAPAKECYEYANGKDTISLSLAITNGNNVSGDLKYALFEKDGNTGTFTGMFKGDTLYADYMFQSEGMTSVREAVFLRKGDALLQGFGDITEKDNKQVFKDKKSVKFDEKMALKKVACE